MQKLTSKTVQTFRMLAFKSSPFGTKTIIIMNAKNLDEDSVKKHFEKFGSIKQVNFKDAQFDTPKRGFVEFEQESSAEKASSSQNV